MITTCTTHMSKYQNEIGTLVGIGVNGWFMIDWLIHCA